LIVEKMKSYKNGIDYYNLLFDFYIKLDDKNKTLSVIDDLVLNDVKPDDVSKKLLQKMFYKDEEIFNSKNEGKEKVSDLTENGDKEIVNYKEIIVSNLNSNINENDLYEYFEKFGKISSFLRSNSTAKISFEKLDDLLNCAKYEKFHLKDTLINVSIQ
jgi:RNA recognition motif-containing protein